MFDIDTLKIDFESLREDDATFRYSLDDAYFQAVEGPEVSRGTVDVVLNVHKSVGCYELSFHVEGTVFVPCNVCLDDMEQEIENDGKLVVRLGEEYLEDDDMITVSREEPVLDVSWFIYEYIALGVPIKHVHAPGKCNPAMIQVLEEHSAARSSDGEGEKAVDPRWSELEKLKTIIKD